MKLVCKSLLLAAILFGLWETPSGMAAETLILATREKTITNRYAELVLTKVYAQLGINIEFVPYPGARSVKEANEGRADGEVARLTNILLGYSNLREVPVPLFYSELSAFVHDDYKIDISGWESLRNHSLTTVRGFEYVRKKLAGQSTRLVETSDEAIKMVENDLVEIAVLNHLLGTLAIAKIGAKHVKAYNPPLERLSVYHFLHKKHETLIPKLTTVLENMEQSGELRALWEDFIIQETLKSTQ